MSGRDLRALIAAYRDGDDLSFRRAANAIIEEEEAKKHTALARELRRLLASGSDVSAPLSPGTDQTGVPRDKESDLPLVDLSRPRRTFSSIILPDDTRHSLDELINELGRWPELDSAGIPRRQTILLAGPPGCGKTSVAEALATETNRTLAVVRTESVVSSLLGETSSNIARVFDFAIAAPYVLLFDEFDSLGKSRDDNSDHGELRRVVNAVLHLIDRYRGPSIIVAATNHAKILDAALWRRFDEVYEMDLPSVVERHELLERTLQGRLEAGVSLASISQDLDGLPHAAVERTATDALRAAVLGGRKRVQQRDLDLALRRTVKRRWL